DCAAAHTPENRAIGIRVPETETRHDGDVLVLRFTDGFQYPADARRVDSDRLLAEDMLIGIHRGLKVQWPEHRGCGQQDDVHPGIDHLLVSIKPDIFVPVFYLDF